MTVFKRFIRNYMLLGYGYSAAFSTCRFYCSRILRMLNHSSCLL